MAGQEAIFVKEIADIPEDIDMDFDDMDMQTPVVSKGEFDDNDDDEDFPKDNDDDNDDDSFDDDKFIEEKLQNDFRCHPRRF